MYMSRAGVTFTHQQAHKHTGPHNEHNNQKLTHAGFENLGREQKHAQSVPQESAQDRARHQDHHLVPEIVIGKRRQLDHLIQLGDELPRCDNDTTDACKNTQKQWMVLEHAFHPGTALVVREEHTDHLTRLHEEHHGVEQVGHEGGGPIGLHLAHEVVFAAVGVAGDLVGLGLLEELGDLF